MKFFSKEVKIGIIAILAVVIIYVGIIFLKGLTFSSTNNMYYVEMADVNGLSPAADIMVNGMKVGTVKTLNFNQERQTVVVSIDMNESFRIPVGSTATLSKDMLGAPKLKITLGKDPQKCLAQGDTIHGIPMSDLMSAAGNMIPKVEELLPKADSIMTTLHALVSDPAIAGTLHNLEALTADLRVAAHQLNTVLDKQVPPLFTNANTVLGKASNVMGNLETTTKNLSQADITGIVENANRTIAQLQQFTEKLNDPNSSLGRLMGDASMYNHLDSTAQNASLLLQDLREHPKRYVHFSLFGKKDKK